jgi:hypothetical protein
MTVSKPSAELLKELQAIGKTMTQEWKDEAPKEVGEILSRYEN